MFQFFSEKGKRGTIEIVGVKIWSENMKEEKILQTN